MNKSKLIFFLFIFVMGVLPAQAQIKWMSLAEAQIQAVKNNKKVMIFAEADWCSYCKKMHRSVFPRQSVQDSLHKYFYPVRIDVESQDTVTFNGDKFTESGLSGKFRVSSTPTTIFLDPQGEIIGAQPGYLPAAIFDKLLAFVGRDLTGTIPFRKYLKENGVKVER